MLRETMTTKAFHALARAVVARLPNYTVKEYPEKATHWLHCAHNVSGAEISIALEAHPKPMLRVSGIWPRRKPHGAYGEFQPKETGLYTIRVSPSKTADRIAADITRRLLGIFEAEYAVQAGRLAAALTEEDCAIRVAERIAASLNETSHVVAGRGGHRISLYDMFQERRGTGEVTVNPDGDEPSVNLELRGLTADEAIRALAVIRGDVVGHAILARLDESKEAAQ